MVQQETMRVTVIGPKGNVERVVTSPVGGSGGTTTTTTSKGTTKVTTPSQVPITTPPPVSQNESLQTALNTGVGVTYTNPQTEANQQYLAQQIRSQGFDPTGLTTRQMVAMLNEPSRYGLKAGIDSTQQFSYQPTTIRAAANLTNLAGEPTYQKGAPIVTIGQNQLPPQQANLLIQPSQPMTDIFGAPKGYTAIASRPGGVLAIPTTNLEPQSKPSTLDYTAYQSTPSILQERFYSSQRKLDIMKSSTNPLEAQGANAILELASIPRFIVENPVQAAIPAVLAIGAEVVTGGAATPFIAGAFTGLAGLQAVQRFSSGNIGGGIVDVALGSLIAREGIIGRTKEVNLIPENIRKFYGTPRTEEMMQRPFIIKPKLSPDTEIPLSLQKFRETQTSFPSPKEYETGTGQVLQGVQRQASVQQLQQALKNIIIIQKPIFATEESGLTSSVFSNMFQKTLKKKGQRALLIEPTEQYAPLSPATELIRERRVIPLYMPSTNQISRQDLASKQLFSPAQLAITKTSQTQILKTEPSLNLIQKQSPMTITNTRTNLNNLLSAAVITQTILKQTPIQETSTAMNTPTPKLPIRTFTPGFELPGREPSKKSGYGALFGRYTPNLRGIEKISLGTKTRKGQRSFTGLEIRGLLSTRKRK